MSRSSERRALESLGGENPDRVEAGAGALVQRPLGFSLDRLPTQAAAGSLQFCGRRGGAGRKLVCVEGEVDRAHRTRR